MTKTNQNSPLEEAAAPLEEATAKSKARPAKAPEQPKADKPAAPAKPVKPTKAAEQPKEGKQLDLASAKKRYRLKVDSIQIPMFNPESKKMEWVDVPASRFKEAEQDALFAYWNDVKAENEAFNIQAKIAKLLEEV